MGFEFEIVQTLGVENPKLLPVGQGEAVFVGSELFTLYFKNSFTRVEQRLDNAYFGGNIFRESRLIYNGGKLQFENSNQVYDSDLVLGGDRDTPEVKHLLNDFKWRPKSPSTEDPGKH